MDDKQEFLEFVAQYPDCIILLARDVYDAAVARVPNLDLSRYKLSTLLAPGTMQAVRSDVFGPMNELGSTYGTN